jgi:hypothetical protein
MARLTSQGTVIMIDDPATAPTSNAVTAATKAKPCVLTVTATAPAVGDIVVPRDTGFGSLDGRPFKVSASVALAVTLEDSDTTGETATLSADAVIEAPTWLELCRSTFNLNAPAGATIDVTTLCDDAHRIVAGLPAVGTWTANGFYDMNDAAMFAARDAYRSGENVLLDVRFRDGSGVTYSGTVNTFDLTLGVNAPVANNIGGNVDGLVSFYKTPPAGFVAPGAAPAPNSRRRRAPAAPARAAA